MGINNKKLVLSFKQCVEVARLGQKISRDPHAKFKNLSAVAYCILDKVLTWS